jgi:hypothetical protein
MAAELFKVRRVWALKWLSGRHTIREGERAPWVGIVSTKMLASPLLANVYLHYVFDLWVRQWRQRNAKGEVIVVRTPQQVRQVRK